MAGPGLYANIHAKRKRGGKMKNILLWKYANFLKHNWRENIPFRAIFPRWKLFYFIFSQICKGRVCAEVMNYLSVIEKNICPKPQNNNSANRYYFYLCCFLEMDVKHWILSFFSHERCNMIIHVALSSTAKDTNVAFECFYSFTVMAECGHFKPWTLTKK